MLGSSVITGPICRTTPKKRPARSTPPGGAEGEYPEPRQVKRHRPEGQTAEPSGQEHHHAGGEKRAHVVAEQVSEKIP